MDVLEHLIQEHRKVEQLLDRLSSSSEGPQRTSTLDELEESLSTHMAVEERFVYPIVKRVLGAEESHEGENEHDLTRNGLAEARRLVAEPGFVAAVEMLEAGIGHHVEEEEDDVFPKLRERAADQIAALGDPEELEEQVEGSGPSSGAGPTKDELYRQAQEAGVEGRSNMSKDELAEALNRS